MSLLSIFHLTWALTCALENVEISDYLKEGDVGFKKPKVSLH